MRGFGPRNGSVWVAVSVVLVLLAFAARPSRGAEPSLAIGGYDPVAYFTQGRATKGDPNYEYVWDDTRYRFVSAQDRDLLTARPEQYAPRNSQATARCRWRTGSKSNPTRNTGSSKTASFISSANSIGPASSAPILAKTLCAPTRIGVAGGTAKRRLPPIKPNSRGNRSKTVSAPRCPVSGSSARSIEETANDHRTISSASCVTARCPRLLILVGLAIGGATLPACADVVTI